MMKQVGSGNAIISPPFTWRSTGNGTGRIGDRLDRIVGNWVESVFVWLDRTPPLRGDVSGIAAGLQQLSGTCR